MFIVCSLFLIYLAGLGYSLALAGPSSRLAEFKFKLSKKSEANAEKSGSIHFFLNVGNSIALGILIHYALILIFQKLAWALLAGLFVFSLALTYWGSKVDPKKNRKRSGGKMERDERSLPAGPTLV